MSSDYAWLFPASHLPASLAWLDSAAVLLSLGAKFTGHVTRLSPDSRDSSWRLTTESESGVLSNEVDAWLARWHGVALDLESRFGPLKLITWQRTGPVSTGVCVLENSHALALQANDPDVKSLFDDVGCRIANLLDVDMYCLVGDPALVELDCLSAQEAVETPPTPSMDPLYLTINQRRTGKRGHLQVNSGWKQRHTGEFDQYVNPILESFAD